MAGEFAGVGERTKSPPPNPRIAWEGCSVLLDINDGDRLAFARLSPAATLKIGNKKCALSPLVGCPFGSLFQVQTGPNGPHLVRCVPSSAAATDGTSMQEKDAWQSKDEAKDNRGLVDSNTAQGLSSEDIDAMRREGATGDEIVNALIANSSTFEKKTSFSQEKYKLKKQKKYAPKVLLRRPFTRSICEAYFKKYPTRIGDQPKSSPSNVILPKDQKFERLFLILHDEPQRRFFLFLRVDTLSLLLSMGNVGAYSDVLVVDMVGGILTGAVAERLGGTSYVCGTYFGTTSYPLDIVRMFNFNSEVCSRILQAPFSDICPSQNNDVACSNLDEQLPSSEIQSNIGIASLSPECTPSGGSTRLSEDQIIQEGNSSSHEQPACTREISFSLNSETMATNHCTASCADGINEIGPSIIPKSVSPGRRASPELIKSWKEKGFTSLIVAAPEMEVECIIQQLLPLLSYSSPFAIYHQYLQPLATCMHKLQASKMAIGLQISEPWLREYQVLPSRTHPHMQMSGFGGYILSGTRISNNDACSGN